MCWAFDLADPWGNQYELNCHDYDRVRIDLVDAQQVMPVRYWPVGAYHQWVGRDTGPPPPADR